MPTARSEKNGAARRRYPSPDADLTERLAAALSCLLESSEQGHAADCEGDCQFCLDRQSGLHMIDVFDGRAR